jgi:oligopeptide/dipeptide ABC transporter ATP-binding protein
LEKRFRARQGLGRRSTVAAVDGVSVEVLPGQTVALVGESGSGKSTVGKMLMGLLKPDSGEVRFEGELISSLRREKWDRYRRSSQMVFQNPMRSFSPMLTIGSTLRDALRAREKPERVNADAEVTNLLARVRLPADFARRYPSQMSGGQLQRVGIARALAPRPRVIFLDEPTSALDVSLHGLIINLLLDLQQEEGLSYILVAHDLRIVRVMAQHVIVMYLGHVMEEGPADDIFNRPHHPYTLALLTAAQLVEHLDTRGVNVVLQGEVTPVPADYSGCKFYNRCPFAMDPCREPQVLTKIGPRHTARCWRATKVAEMAGTREQSSATDSGIPGSGE